MASIKIDILSNGKRRYRVRVRYRGTYRSGTFSSRRVAQRFADQVERQAELADETPAIQAEGRLFSELVERYEATVMPGKKASTQQQQRAVLAFWRYWFYGKTLAQVTSEEISQAKGAGLARGWKASTWNGYHSLLHHVLAHGVRELKWLPANPAADVARMRQVKGRSRFLSDGELQRLILMVRMSPCRWLHIITLLALSTGARRGEIASLTWERLDLQWRPDCGRGLLGCKDGTKNQTERAIYITGEALAMMRRMELERQPGMRHCFPSPRYDRPVAFSHSWYVALERARLEDFHFHDLRHTAASYVAMSGGSERDIAEFLGHLSPASSRRYSHLVESYTVGVTTRMNDRFLGGKNGSQSTGVCGGVQDFGRGGQRGGVVPGRGY